MPRQTIFAPLSGLRPVEPSPVVYAPLSELQPVTTAPTVSAPPPAAATRGMLPQSPAGLLEAGNIDLFKQPSVQNPRGGGRSTVQSFSVNFDGREVLLPTVMPDGRLLSEEDAIKEYETTGRHLGVFDSPVSATAYADQLHKDYEAGKYRPKPMKADGVTDPASVRVTSAPSDVARVPTPARGTGFRPDRPMQIVKGVARGAASIPEGLAESAAAVARLMPPSVPGLSTPGGAMKAAIPAAEAVSAAARDVRESPTLAATPEAAKIAAVDPLTNPEVLAQPDWWIENVSEGLGSQLAFLLPAGLLNTLMKTPAAVAKGAPILERAKRLLVASRGVDAGAALEAAVEAGLQQRDALDKGVEPERAAELAAKAFAAQFTLLIGTAVPGYVLPGASKLATRTAAGAAGESVQEGGQAAISNVVAKEYDPTRQVSEGVTAGAIVGGILGAGASVARPRAAQAPPGPPPAPNVVLAGQPPAAPPAGAQAPPTTITAPVSELTVVEPPAAPVPPAAVVASPAPPPAPAPVAPSVETAGEQPTIQSKEPRKFSSTQINLPAPIADAIVAKAAAISDEDLAPDGRAGATPDTAPHVTVKYGLHTADAEEVRALLADEPPITVTLGKTSFFPNGESGSGDVLKVDVDSPDLHRLNAKIAEALDVTDTHPIYRPHVTIAYVKPGLGEKYAGDESLKGQTVTLDSVRFAGKDGQQVDIPLTGTREVVGSEPTGEPKPAEPSASPAQPELSHAPAPTTREPWQMTRAEFNVAQRQPKVDAIKAALKKGTPITLATNARATRLAIPEHIRITKNGDVQIPRGRQWDTLTDPQIDALAAQAGITPVPYGERTYHRSAVEEALQAGRDVPAAVRAEYPEFAQSDAPPVDTPTPDGEVWRKAFPQSSWETLEGRTFSSYQEASAFMQERGIRGRINSVTRSGGPKTFEVQRRAAQPQVDRLDTGEAQPRLPEAGSVREREVVTPQMEAPFSLASEASAATTGRQTSLLDAVRMPKIGDQIEWFIGPNRLRRTGQVLDVLSDGAFRVHVDDMKTTPVRTVLSSAQPRLLDTPAAQAQTVDRGPEPRTGEVAGEEGLSAPRRVEPSVARRPESRRQRDARAAEHFTAVFDVVHALASEVDPAVDPADLRAEFDFRTTFIREQLREFQESGQNPRLLLRAIAKNGGLGPESHGGLTGEYTWLKEGNRGGAVAGVAGVFRAKRTLDERGQPKTGLGFDVMVQRLQQDPQFAWVENTDILMDAIDNAIRHGAPLGETFPGTKELAKSAGMKPDAAWWIDSWRPQELAAEPSEIAVEEGDTSFNPEELEDETDDDSGGGSAAMPRGGPLVPRRPKTDTAAFREWFGDSKVVDEDGKPLVVYHGTDAAFTEFATDRGAWFTENPRYASLAAEAASEVEGGGGNVRPVYLSIQNPATLEQFRDASSRGDRASAIAELTADGYDGAIGNEGQDRTFIAFAPAQVKSAIGNRGTFNRNDPNILAMPRGGPLVPGRSGTLQPSTKPMLPYVRPDQINAKLARAFNNLPIAVGKLHPSNRGVFKNPTGVIRTQLSGDYYAIFHEFGHALDLMVTKWSATNKRGVVANELKKLGAPTSRPGYTANQRRKEGVAEYVRRWLMEDPSALRTEAPEFSRAFEAFIANRHPVAQALADAKQRTQQYLALSPAEQFDLMVDYGDRRVPEVAEKVAAWTFGTEGDPRTALDRLSSSVNDDLYRLWQIEVDLKGGRQIDPGESVYWLLRTLRGTPGQAQAFLEGPVTRADGTRIGPGLYEALKGRMDKYRDIAAYMVATRAARAKDLGVVSGFTDEQIEAKLKDLKDDPDVVQGAKDIAAFRRAFLTYLEERGLLTKDLRAIWEKRWGDTYIPFHRIGSTVRESKGSGGAGRLRQNARVPFRRFTGSMLAIKDPIRAMVEDTFKSVAAAEENFAMNELLDLAKLPGAGRWIEIIPADQSPVKFNLQQLRKDILEELTENGIEVDDSVLLDDAFLDRMVTVWMPHTHAVGNKHYVTALDRDGKRVWAQVHDEGLWNDIITVGPQTSGWLVRFLQPAASLVRSTATLNLPFMVRNVIRDIGTAKLYSPTGYSVKDWAGGFYSILTRDDSWHKFMTSRAAQATFNAQDRDLMKRELQRMDKTGLRKWLDMTVLHPFDGLAALRELTENATRAGAIKRQLVHEDVLDEAVMRRIGALGRDVTQDFQKVGHAVREFNRVSAFVAARVGGYTRAGEEARAHPGRLTKRVTPYVVMALALWYLNRDDDEYEEVDGWEKRTYHHIPVPQALRDLGWGPFVRFPRLFEYGDLTNLIEAALDWKVKDDPKVVDRLPFQGSTDLAWQVVLTLMPDQVLPILEVGANYDTFRDRPIVNPYDLGLDPELQYNRWTSETAKKVGGAIGVAPAKIDHLIYGYTTGVGREVVTRLDQIAALAGDGPSRPGRGPRDLPAVSALYTGAALSTSSASVNQFYRELERLEGAASSIHRYVDSGQTDKAKAVGEKEGLGIAWRGRQMTVTSPRLKALRESSRQMKALRGNIDAVYRDRSMTASVKEDALNDLALTMTNIARTALGQSVLTRTARERPQTVGAR